MKQFFADLHIHIGKTGEGKPVKITASRELTFENIIKEALTRKGIDILGIVDCQSPGVLKDIKDMIKKRQLLELPEGGLLHKDKVTVLLASELETCQDDGSTSHQLAYFPFLKQISSFSNRMQGYISNIYLSSQRCFLSASELLKIVKDEGGILIPAHAFTPHKSIYGKAARRLSDIFEENLRDIFAIELGLSADTFMADHLNELDKVTFLSNSDAHSLSKIGREYNLLQLARPNFKEFVLALRRISDRKVIKNFGLDPKLGKYHRSFCINCKSISSLPPPVLACPKCKDNNCSFVKGVLDRLVEIEDHSSPVSPSHRPPYQYQIPLDLTPGVSAKIMEILIKAFGSEMAVIHNASRSVLAKAVGYRIAEYIDLARTGRLQLMCGGGGKYGRVEGIKDTRQLTFL